MDEDINTGLRYFDPTPGSAEQQSQADNSLSAEKIKMAIYQLGPNCWHKNVSLFQFEYLAETVAVNEIASSKINQILKDRAYQDEMRRG